MDVYAMMANRKYSGGAILIAADSPEEALNVVMSDDFWMRDLIYQFTPPEIVKDLVCVTPEPKVILKSYYFE